MKKEQQKQIITEIMDEVDKLAHHYNPVMKLDAEFIRAGFKAGYNKAKEMFYTEEQVREAIKYALNEAKEAVLWIDTYHNIVSDKFIQSLKQPKKD